MSKIKLASERHRIMFPSYKEIINLKEGDIIPITINPGPGKCIMIDGLSGYYTVVEEEFIKDENGKQDN